MIKIAVYDNNSKIFPSKVFPRYMFEINDRLYDDSGTYIDPVRIKSYDCYNRSYTINGNFGVGVLLDGIPNCLIDVIFATIKQLLQ